MCPQCVSACRTTKCIRKLRQPSSRLIDRRGQDIERAAWAIMATKISRKNLLHRSCGLLGDNQPRQLVVLLSPGESFVTGGRWLLEFQNSSCEANCEDNGATTRSPQTAIRWPERGGRKYAKDLALEAIQRPSCASGEQ